jgi:hypothetical protein
MSTTSENWHPFGSGRSIASAALMRSKNALNSCSKSSNRNSLQVTQGFSWVCSPVCHKDATLYVVTLSIYWCGDSWNKEFSSKTNRSTGFCWTSTTTTATDLTIPWCFKLPIIRRSLQPCQAARTRSGLKCKTLPFGYRPCMQLQYGWYRDWRLDAWTSGQGHCTFV